MTKFVAIREGRPSEFTIDVHNIAVIERHFRGESDARYNWINVIFKQGGSASYTGYDDEVETALIYKELNQHAVACNDQGDNIKDMIVESQSDALPNNSKVEGLKNVFVETFPQISLLEYRQIQNCEHKKFIDAEYTFLVIDKTDFVNLKQFLELEGFSEYGPLQFNLSPKGEEPIFPAVCELSVTLEEYKELGDTYRYFVRFFPYNKGIQLLMDKLGKGDRPNERT